MSLSQDEEERGDEWDLDTDDINSVDSDELHENRPNRWRGPRWQWSRLTEQDRQEYTAFQNIRSQDLSIHLYNASALKRRQRATASSGTGLGAGAGAGAGNSTAHQHNDWVPPPSRTAWPVKTSLLPSDDFTRGPDDEDDVFTFRKQGTGMPSEVLEEMISATMLRLAKETFTKRGLTEQAERDPTAGAARSSHSSTHVQGSNEETKPDTTAAELGSTTNPTEETDDGFVPVVSAADDVSYELTRPATRRILARLDQTLTVLHNARMAGLSYLTDSSATNTPDTDSEGPPGSHRRSRSVSTTGRKRGRPRSKGPPTTTPKPRSGETTSDAGSTKSRRGRPRKQHFPREGETEKEMLIRIARENHRRLPVFSDDESEEPVAQGREKEEEEEGEDQGEEEEEEERRRAFGSMAEQVEMQAKMETDEPIEGTGKGKQQRRRQRPKRLPGESTKEFLRRIARDRHQRLPRFPDDDSSDSSAEQDRPQETEQTKGSNAELNRSNLLGRWALRDWSDVVGAAALAGFSPDVIHRTAQRCATLFGQSMTMSTLSEVPAGRTRGGGGGGGIVTRSYPAPYRQEAAFSEDDDHDVDMIGSSQKRIVSRQSSVAPPGSSPSPSSSSGEKNRAEPSLKRRHRSSSVISQVGRHYCSFQDCPRALQGFSRNYNLERHMRLVHGIVKHEARLGDETGDADGDDEGDGTEGAVHIDGFLQPIRAQKGWRSEDIGARRRSQSRGRSMSRASQDTGDDHSVT